MSDTATREKWEQVADWGRRLRRPESSARRSLLLILKSALAATVSWFISYELINATSPAFAPFSAVLMVQVTVYQSVVQSLRYVGAVAAGVAVQAVLGLSAGPDLVTFALVALVALVISRWRVLGAQGSQVATAAFFAFATYTGASSNTDQVKELGQIVLLVLIGSAVGVGVNVLIAPPLRYRSAEWGIRALAQEIHDLLDTMTPELGEGAPDADTTRGWRDRADRTGTLITRSREGLRTARESLRLNPRPWARRRRRTITFEAYDRTMEALVRMISQVAAITRSLDQQHRDEEESSPDRDYAPFLRAYATFLSSVVDFTKILATLDEDHLRDQAGRLDEASDDLERCRGEVVRSTEERDLSLTDPTEPYGVLVVEATRLSEECRYTADVLGNSADNPPSGSRTA
ncbi:aromatic acid exporter family protein [Streptomyces albidoflavus]|uniref:FUSC family protein n=1 Tax=Streptomyces TaxID=1883 RepID=UPI001E607E40|nr:aromatic acid exporter family protein [Streptomyces sp. OUCMDZ-3434]WSB21294.1 aromatic acid exporter family protein [Streptomyces albidoflavus]